MKRRANNPMPPGFPLSKKNLQKARLDYEAFQTTLYAAHPELKTQRGEAQPLSIEQIAGLLPDAKTALVEFIVTEKKTYLFALTRNNKGAGAPSSAGVNIKVYPIDVAQKDLAERSERFRKQLAQRDLGFRQMARELYDLLLKPAQTELQGKTFVVIVPDAELWKNLCLFARCAPTRSSLSHPIL